MIFAEDGGTGADLLVLLHGLGATGGVWRPMLDAAAAHWSGRWLVLDLPGHGASQRQDGGYRIGQTAATVARAIRPHFDARGRLVVLGHSLGGVIGFALASGLFAVTPSHVLTIGIKCNWRNSELAHMVELASRPAKRFPDAAAAWARYLKVAGLSGLVEVGSPALARGVTEENGAWRLAADPAANDAGLPPLAALAAAAVCPIHMARGANDVLVSLDETRNLDPSARDLDGCGHNAMIEAPQRVWDWFSGCLP
jgi:pimeloyl-ACP methyl ester carboxylesterase